MPTPEPFQVNEEGYKDLFDNALDLIHFIDLDGTILQVNRSWLNLLAYERNEVVGSSLASLLVEEDRDRFTQYRKKVINGSGDTGHIIFRVQAKNGRVLTLEGFISLKIKDGQPEYTRGIFRDISAKTASEKRLRERERNFSNLLLHAPDPVVVIDRHSRIQFWNPRAERLFGYTMEEVTGTDLADKIIPPQYRDAHRNGMQRYLATGEAHVLNNTIHITAINKAQEEFHVSLTISNASQDEEPVFIAFIRDTRVERKNEMESELRKKQLEMSNEQLRQFAHVASHDMKEPVRKIMLFSERLEQKFGDQLPEPALQFLAKINGASERLRNIIDGFLNYAHVNGVSEVYETTRLEAILAQVESDLELRIADKNARLEYGSFPEFEAIPFLIYHLMYNLVYNALKFTAAGTDPVVKIAAAIKSREDLPRGIREMAVDFLEITVADNGIGFSPADASKIFNSFVRLNAQSAFEGTGLGLTLCKNIVDRHNGLIQAESQPGSGAIFRILLPLKKIS